MKFEHLNIFLDRLRDESPKVKKNTLQVLTHLILNDMVKVKGQISEMATCIVDCDERISNLAKVFFLELSRKVSFVAVFIFQHREYVGSKMNFHFI